MTGSPDGPSVFDRISNLLTKHGVEFDVLHHEPVYTSEEAARVRGAELASGAKALVCKADESFMLFVLPANLKLSSKNVRKQLSIRSLRFASRDEVQQLTSLQPGSIPPFGSLFELQTLCDLRLGENQIINFNAGDHSISVAMPYAAYIQVESPRVGDYGES